VLLWRLRGANAEPLLLAEPTQTCFNHGLRVSLGTCRHAPVHHMHWLPLTMAAFLRDLNSYLV